MSAESQSGSELTGQPGGTWESPQAMREHAQKQKQEEKAEQVAASSLQQAIEDSLNEDTCRLSVGGERISFRTFNGSCEGHPDTGGEISRHVSLIAESFARMDGDNYREEFTDEADWMAETLAWASEPEWMTAEWWTDHVSVGRQKSYLQLIQTERDFSEKQIKKLRTRGKV